VLTAHLPAGYLLWRASPQVLGGLAAALAGAVFPDIDMLWFHLVDDRAFHHHYYWVHVPLFWLAVAAVGLPLLWRTAWRGAALVFLAAITLHLILDTIVGGILWGAPVSDHLFALVEVPATHSHWVWSFVLHWTFLLEVAVWIAATVLFARGRA
jgi:hypothetical protein